MAKLIFKAEEVRRVVEHSLAAPAQGESYEGKPSAAAFILVHDQGVYLMSNGKPADLIGKGEAARSFVAYAEGCDPRAGDDWYDTAHDLVGGDDFGEWLPWAAEAKKMLDAGATYIIIGFGRRISLSARYPKGKAPKAEPAAPESPDAMVKRLKRIMRGKVAALDPVTNKIQIFKVAPLPAMIERVQRQRPSYKILNGLPTLEIYKAVALHQQAREGAR